MRNAWMCGVLDAEMCVKEYGDIGAAYGLLSHRITPVVVEYWRGFADYLHNYELRNKEGVV